jgi:anthranilate phosphoribosyltransferase
MTLQEALALLVERTDLTRDQAAGVLHEIMSGASSAAQIAAVLVALRMKGETVNEIAGFAETMRAFATHVPTVRRPLVDTCGTGGDALGTFNISTTAAFVVSGAGIAVAKHGNRSASSKCGSADVLEALGVNLDLPPEAVGKCIDEVGIGFLFARSLHGAMKHVAPVRAELRIRTVFNLLGPLTNPAGADRQVIGVYDTRRVKDLAEVLQRLGAQHAFVVCGSDGLDEITLSGPTNIAEVTPSEVRTYEVTPEMFGVASAPVSALAGGDADTNARILRGVLSGEPGPKRDVVLANAAAAIRAADDSTDWTVAMDKARASIDSGKAAALLDSLVEFSTASKN